MLAWQNHAGVLLALAHVWLVEWIDAEDGRGRRGGNLPPKELLPNGINIIYNNPHKRQAGGLKRFDVGILCSSRCRRQT